MKKKHHTKSRFSSDTCSDSVPQIRISNPRVDNVQLPAAYTCRRHLDPAGHWPDNDHNLHLDRTGCVLSCRHCFWPVPGRLLLSVCTDYYPRPLLQRNVAFHTRHQHRKIENKSLKAIGKPKRIGMAGLLSWKMVSPNEELQPKSRMDSLMP